MQNANTHTHTYIHTYKHIFNTFDCIYGTKNIKAQRENDNKSDKIKYLICTKMSHSDAFISENGKKIRMPLPTKIQEYRYHYKSNWSTHDEYQPWGLTYCLY